MSSSCSKRFQLFFIVVLFAACLSLSANPVVPDTHRTLPAPMSLGISEEAVPVSEHSRPNAILNYLSVPGHLKELSVLTAYFGLWYGLTIVYNIANKNLLNVFPLPATVATAQLFLGIPLFLPLWLFPSSRKSVYNPKLTVPLLKIASAHSLGNLATVSSLGAGAVSFTHIIKAAEPVFSAVLSATILGTTLPTTAYASLLPIVAGVGLASASELTFTWFAFSTAMLSNLCYQLRNVLTKLELSKIDVSTSDSEPLTSAQLFRLVTVFAAIQLLPVALLLEGPSLWSTWRQAEAAGVDMRVLLTNLLVSGLSYYMYNEVSFWILSRVSPVTLAVGNAVKRVVIVMVSVLVLGAKMTATGAAGSCIAVLGTLLYSSAVARAASGNKKSNQYNF